MTFPRDRMIALAAVALLGLSAAVLSAAAAGAGASARPGGAGAAAAAAGLSWTASQMVTRHPPGAGNNLSCPAATFCALVDGNGYVHALDAISCLGTDFCVSFDEPGFAIQTRGTAVQNRQQLTNFTGAISLSCASTQFCAALNFASDVTIGRSS